MKKLCRPRTPRKVSSSFSGAGWSLSSSSRICCGVRFGSISPATRRNQGQSGAYTGQGSGLYICVGNNVLQLFGQAANTLELQGGDFSNATATAATITAGGDALSFPLNPFGTYKFSCVLLYTNTGTN